MNEKQLAIAITGAGGAGVISSGELILQAWAQQGGRGFMRKAFGPQIRGGESAALLKLTEDEHYTPARHYDLLVALDWVNFTRFEDEILIDASTIVICQQGQQVPAGVEAAAPTVIALPLAQLAADGHPEGRVNMLAAGLLAAILDLPVQNVIALAARRLSAKPEAYRQAAAACIELGLQNKPDCQLLLPALGDTGCWYLSGNQAAGFGALEAGVRFVAAYPITPATDVLEWLAGGLEKVGGQLVQAEDELAAINMTIGAAFGGIPAFTATSGPGLALMAESIGLAVASETPLTVLNVMRGGPSTGIPTKSEQSDLNLALFGLHGDAPHLVLAPLTIADCVFTTGWAVKLAQLLQTTAIVLSDQFIGQSSAVISEPRRCLLEYSGIDAGNSEDNGDYLRYKLTDSGISTLAAPGEPDRRFTADGLEHNEKGTPSAKQSDHLLQLDKRQRKLDRFHFGDEWAELGGTGKLALLTFGSSSLAINEAAALLRQQGIESRTISLRLLAPLQREALATALEDCELVLVVEQNHTGQLFHYLKGCMDCPCQLHSYARPGPVPLNPRHIADYLKEAIES